MQGFYYIHESCMAKQVKDRLSSIVIQVIDGILVERLNMFFTVQVEMYCTFCIP